MSGVCGGLSEPAIPAKAGIDLSGIRSPELRIPVSAGTETGISQGGRRA